MYTTHMTYVVVAFVILSLVILSVNRVIVEKTTVMTDSEASLTAISVAQAMIDEIQTTEFDEKTIGARIYTPTNMTISASLGVDAGEEIALPDVYPYLSQIKFDDVDDYNGYKRTANTTRMGGFTVEDSIYYVTGANLNVKSIPQTFYKKVVVKVMHPSMKQPVVLTDIYVYRRYL